MTRTVASKEAELSSSWVGVVKEEVAGRAESGAPAGVWGEIPERGEGAEFAGLPALLS